FAALFQQPENELELIFKGDFSYSALSLAFEKLKTERPELDLELKGIEQRGNLWVVRVTSSNPTIEGQLEQQISEVYQTATNSDSLETTIKDSIYRDYEDIKQRLVDSQQQVRQWAGIAESQAETLKQLSKQTFGTNFYIEGSNITNLTGQGQIEYTEAAGQIRSLVTQSGTETQVFQQVLSQLQDIATTPQMQTELIQQILLKEAQNDPAFRRFLLQQQQQILTALPAGTIASAIQDAILQLSIRSF
ncbi:MAG: pentapeptide repeat-containing protein, partial [Elainella sp.]